MVDSPQPQSLPIKRAIKRVDAAVRKDLLFKDKDRLCALMQAGDSPFRSVLL